MEQIAHYMPLFVATLAFIVADWATGLCAAAKAGEIRSDKMRDGLWHKLAFVLAVVLAVALEWACTVVDLGISVPAVPAVAAYIILTELASVTENLSKLNPAIASSPIGGLFAGRASREED